MEKNTHKDFSAILHILGFVSKWKYRYTFGLILNAASQYTYAMLIGMLIGGLLEQVQNTNLAELTRSTLFYSSLILGYLLIMTIARYAFDSAVSYASMEMRQGLFHHMVHLPMDSSLNAHSGENISRLDSDAAYSVDLLGYIIRQPISLLITLVAGFITVTSIHWLSGVALVVLGLIFLLIKIKIAKLSRKHFSARQSQMGKTVSYMSDILLGAQTVRIYNRDSRLLQGFIKACAQLRAQSMRAFTVRTVQNGLGQVEAALAYACSTGIGLLLFYNGMITLSQLPILLQIGSMLVSAISNIGGLIGNMQESLAGASRVIEVLSMEQEIGDDAQINTGGDEYDIESCNVSVQYNRHTVLNNISIAIPKGQTWAIVGASGSGKSTMIKLLMGACPYDGELLVRGNDVSKLNARTLRSLTAYVPQECPLFEGSIYENIRMGNLDASPMEVEKVIRDADLEEFISQLPEGYYTQVGERGVQLSGGQRQRIAIARAMLKDAPIILLDEITSSLDASTERKIQDALNRLTKGRTVLIVTHRLYTVQDVDRILILSQGEIVEQGTHEELIQNKELYYKMIKTQVSA